jgi:GNAT superfamily N-acetyltransferase
MRAAVRGQPAGACTPAQRAAWSSLPALYHRWAMGPGGERYLVAERDGRIVGYAAYRGAPAVERPTLAAARRAPVATELTALFVHPSAGREGLGRRLVRAAEARARRLGARSLRILAARPAIGFYEALGYVQVRDALAPLPGGVRLPSAWMRRALEGPLPGSASPPHRRARGG